VNQRLKSEVATVGIDLQSDSLGYAIKLAQVRAYDLLFHMYGPDTLTPARMTALSMISMEPAINQSALASRLGITRASVVKVIDALETLRYIARESIKGNRRSYALMLTPAGQARLREFAEQAKGFEERLASQLTSSERRKLIQLLGKVAATRVSDD
jgi:DNA-binding MarR family transcriptional regulator